MRTSSVGFTTSDDSGGSVEDTRYSGGTDSLGRSKMGMSTEVASLRSREAKSTF